MKKLLFKCAMIHSCKTLVGLDNEQITERERQLAAKRISKVSKLVPKRSEFQNWKPIPIPMGNVTIDETILVDQIE